MKKQYFFGYLFVRAARPLALLVILIGIGFCLLQYSQASAAASAVAYQPSSSLQRALGKLKEACAATQQIVSALSGDNPAAPSLQPLRFPRVVGSNADFARVGQILARLDQEKQSLKESIISRFEASVKSIEAKLRDYAARLRSLPSPVPTSTPVTGASSASPSSASTPQQESLFSPALTAGDVSKRSTTLSVRKEFLKVLQTKAENPDNRAKLADAVGQLDLLSRLLPEKTDSLTEGDAGSGSSNQPGPEQGRKLLPSERVAGELEQLRGEVRQTLLSSWSLDETFEQAADLNSVERDKCRVATLAEKGIWLSAVSRILTGLLAAVLVSFVILVSADLVKTLLDTAAHTGVLADAINALRGSIVTSRRQASTPDLSDGRPGF